MRWRPIQFRADMIQAILDGRKTQTRRLRGLDAVNTEPDAWKQRAFLDGRGTMLALRDVPLAGICKDDILELICPYGAPGDGLWVKRGRFQRKADAAAWLIITGIRVERLQDISDKDCVDEGAPIEDHADRVFSREMGQWVGKRNQSARHSFRALWDAINGKRKGGIYAWERNPWVWVVSFRKATKAEKEAT